MSSLPPGGAPGRGPGAGPDGLLRRHRGRIEFDRAPTETPIGVIVPFDFNLDWEYWQYLPPGTFLHFTRTPHVRLPVGVELARAVGRPGMVSRATRALLAVDPAAVLYACSSGSFVDGPAADRDLRAAMAAVGAPNPVTTSSAMVDALTMAGVRTVAVATPYTATLTRQLVRFLEECGIAVSSCAYLDLKRHIASVSKATIAELVRSLDDDEADAVFVSCTALRTYGIVTGLEGELHRPVFTSNQVSLWRALVAAGALPRAGDAVEPDWTMGGPPPVARSTGLLMGAAEALARPGAA